MLTFGRIGAGVMAALTLTAAGTCFGAVGGDEKYFPKDTEIVVHLNVRQLLNSEMVKTNKTAMAKVKDIVQNMVEMDQEAQKYIKSLGFDVFRDLDGISTVMPGSADPTKTLIIISGKFDRQKFSATAADAADKHGDILKITKAGNYQVIEVSPPNEDKTFYISLVNPTTILVAQGRETLTTALSRATATQGPELRKDVKELLAGRDVKQSLSFMATSAALDKIAQSQAGRNPQVALISPLLRALNGFNGGVDVRKDVQFQIGIVTRDAEAAKKLSQDIGGGIGAVGDMVDAKAKDDPKLRPWVDVVKSIRANSQGTTVMIRGQIPAAVIGEALKQQFNQQ